MMEDSWRWLLRERATERSRVLRTNSLFPLWERKRKIGIAIKICKLEKNSEISKLEHIAKRDTERKI